MNYQVAQGLLWVVRELPPTSRLNHKNKKKWPLTAYPSITPAKGHFCSLLLSNITGYLAFLQILGQNLFIQSSIPSHKPSKFISYTLICEKPQCGKLSSWKAFVLRLPVLSHFFIRSSLFIFRYNLACYFGNFLKSHLYSLRAIDWSP